MKSNDSTDGPGTSKPRLRARRSIVNEGRLRELNAFGGNPIPHSDYRMLLEDWSYAAVRRNGRPFPVIKLEFELLQELIGYEDAISQYKKKLAELETAKAPEEDTSYVKSELMKYRRLR